MMTSGPESVGNCGFIVKLEDSNCLCFDEYLDPKHIGDLSVTKMSWMQSLSVVRVVRSSWSRFNVWNTGALCSPQIGTETLSTGQFKEFGTSFGVLSTAPVTDERGIIRRQWERMTFVLNKKYKLRPLGWMLYRDSVDRIDYLGFFEEFKMPDTYFSWFLVTELHVWMLMVKLMGDGLEGVETRRNIVEAMWEDANMRKKQLGNVKESLVREHMSLIGHQFNAAIIGYDEGLSTSDIVLAGALWRRFLQSECNDPEMVEKLVVYIHQTMIMLDELPFKQVISNREIKWLNYKKLLQSSLQI